VSVKKLKWFKTEESIPDNATYIKTEKKVVREWDEESVSGFPIGIGREYAEFHLYEVPDPSHK
jgi:hypothetical protein